MAIAVKTLSFSLDFQLTGYKRAPNFHARFPLSHRTCFPLQMKNDFQEISARLKPSNKRANIIVFGRVFAISPGLEDVDVSTPPFEDFVVSVDIREAIEIKARIHVSGAKTQKIFDDVFSKLVAAAQPIPGFRRVKGGKTPDVPKHILLQILGASKVYKDVIKKIINSTVAEYVEKEGFKVTKDLRVEQSFEELEAGFEPGLEFIFDALIQLQGTVT